LGVVPTKVLVTSTDPDMPLGSGVDSISTLASEGSLEPAHGDVAVGDLGEVGVVPVPVEATTRRRSPTLSFVGNYSQPHNTQTSAVKEAMAAGTGDPRQLDQLLLLDHYVEEDITNTMPTRCSTLVSIPTPTTVIKAVASATSAKPAASTSPPSPMCALSATDRAPATLSVELDVTIDTPNKCLMMVLDHGAHVCYLLKVCAPATKILDWIGCMQSQKLRSYRGNILGLRPIPWTFFIFVELPIVRYFCLLPELPWAVLAYQCGSSMFVGVVEVAVRLDSSTFHKVADDGEQLGERVAELDVLVSGVEDGLANTILTLPFATQQEILLAMICCSGIGDRKAKLQAQFTQMRLVVRVAQDSLDLLVECCVWFINLLSSESNEVHSYKQSLLNYILLARVYGETLLYKQQPMTIKWYYYWILGIIDVEAHYIVVSAYQYTSLTNVMLRDCWSVPCVIVCSWIFLKAKYGLRNLSGVGVCVAGLILVVFSNVHAFDREKGLNSLTGDLLVIGGSMLHAFSRVTKEYFVHESTRVEVMAMLGVFRAIINGIQISIFKQKELRSTHWTADMWAVLMRTIAYKEKVDVMYFVSFAGTTTGFVIYSYRGSRQNTIETTRVT
jgi:solute carrier family 35, member F1/2